MHNHPVVYPVVHLSDSFRKAEASLTACREAGFDRVFLINQGEYPPTTQDFFEIYFFAVKDLGMNVGINTLGSIGKYKDTRLSGLGAAWEDHYSYFNNFPLRGEKDLGTLTFGGVDFKYQAPEMDTLDVSISKALAVCDVVTTSGPATGTAPHIAKIAQFRTALDRNQDRKQGFLPWYLRSKVPLRLAIASGVNPDNIEGMISAGADTFLVGTFFESSWGVMDKSKLEALAHYGTVQEKRSLGRS